ncbi:sugar transferase [Syntrophotalea carbinolica]|nr:sugar transferase [Syntrophotalea carbinolica]
MKIYVNIFKRIFDFIVTFVGLTLLLPVLFCLAILVKLSSPGPILFKQQRMGQGGKPFIFFKFRTMRVDAPGTGPGVTCGNDPRITPVGRLLRKTKLDELPQLFNVLRGDMSLVGPRPELIKYVQYHREDFAKILSVKPGITDNAAIDYRYEEEILKVCKDVESAYIEKVLPEKIKLYHKYIEGISFRTDLSLIFRTFLRLFDLPRLLEPFGIVKKQCKVCEGVHVCLVGANHLQNDLFVALMKNVLHCRCRFTNIGSRHELSQVIWNETVQKNLLFLDCFALGNGDVEEILHSVRQAIPCGTRLAFYNYRESATSEETVLALGVRCVFHPGDSPQQFCLGTRAILNEM